jgi:hypothetical protein
MLSSFAVFVISLG